MRGAETTSAWLERLFAEVGAKLVSRCSVDEATAFKVVEWVYRNWSESVLSQPGDDSIDKLLLDVEQCQDDVERCEAFNECLAVFLDRAGPLCRGWPQKKSDDVEWKERGCVGLNHPSVGSQLQYASSDPFVQREQEATKRRTVAAKRWALEEAERLPAKTMRVVRGNLCGITGERMAKNQGVSESTISRRLQAGRGQLASLGTLARERWDLTSD